MADSNRDGDGAILTLNNKRHVGPDLPTENKRKASDTPSRILEQNFSKSNHMRLAQSLVTLSEAKGLKRQILRAAQNDSSVQLHCKVYECSVV